MNNTVISILGHFVDAFVDMKQELSLYCKTNKESKNIEICDEVLDCVGKKLNRDYIDSNSNLIDCAIILIKKHDYNIRTTPHAFSVVDFLTARLLEIDFNLNNFHSKRLYNKRHFFRFIKLPYFIEE
jgi:hypothetical protein